MITWEEAKEIIALKNGHRNWENVGLYVSNYKKAEYVKQAAELMANEAVKQDRERTVNASWFEDYSDKSNGQKVLSQPLPFDQTI